jgi:O-antigen/teichoic acid export membrane protein
MTARALQPAQVGILGLAAIVVGIISIIGYYSEIAAVSSAREESHASMALVATIARGAIVGTLAMLVALALPLFGDRITGGPEATATLVRVTSVFGLTLLFELASGYPSIVLQRKLDLAPVAVFQAAQAAVVLTLTALLLLNGSGPIGVAWANVAGSAMMSGLLWIRLVRRHSARPHWPSTTAFRAMLSRTGAMFVGLFGGFLSERFDNLLVAGAIGPSAMSFYSMSWNASHTPANVFSRAINFVLVPALAHIREETNRARRALRECLRYSYVLLSPVCAMFVIGAPEIVTIVLGARWLPAASPLRIMGISVLSAPMLFACAAVLVASGRVKWTGISTLLHLVILAILIPPLAKSGGVVGAAIGELIAVSILTCTVFATAHSVTNVVTVELLYTPLAPIAASALAGSVAWFAGGAIDALWLRFTVKAIALGTVYLSVMFVVARESHLDGLIALLRAMFSRNRTIEATNV